VIHAVLGALAVAGLEVPLRGRNGVRIAGAERRRTKQTRRNFVNCLTKFKTVCDCHLRGSEIVLEIGAALIPTTSNAATKIIPITIARPRDRTLWNLSLDSSISHRTFERDNNLNLIMSKISLAVANCPDQDSAMQNVVTISPVDREKVRVHDPLYLGIGGFVFIAIVHPKVSESV
jgi:hypothetical protein